MNDGELLIVMTGGGVLQKTTANWLGCQIWDLSNIVVGLACSKKSDWCPSKGNQTFDLIEKWLAK